jgi:hypothetical protein
LVCALCIRREAKVSGSALSGTRLHSRWRSRISIACSLSFASSTAISTNDFCSRFTRHGDLGAATHARYKRTRLIADKKEAGGVRIASDSRGGAGEGKSPRRLPQALRKACRGLDDPGFWARPGSWAWLAPSGDAAAIAGLPSSTEKPSTATTCSPKRRAERTNAPT